MKVNVGCLFYLSSSLLTTVTCQYNGTSGFTNATSPAVNTTSSNAHFWLEEISHQGVAAFRQNSTYQVFRNVKDFGAKGLSPPVMYISRS